MADFFSSRIAAAGQVRVGPQGEISAAAEVRVTVRTNAGAREMALSSCLSALVTATAGKTYSQLKNGLQEAVLQLARRAPGELGGGVSGQESDGRRMLDDICSNLATYFNVIFFGNG